MVDSYIVGMAHVDIPYDIIVTKSQGASAGYIIAELVLPMVDFTTQKFKSLLYRRQSRSEQKKI